MVFFVVEAGKVRVDEDDRDNYGDDIGDFRKR